MMIRIIPEYIRYSLTYIPYKSLLTFGLRKRVFEPRAGAGEERVVEEYVGAADAEGLDEAMVLEDTPGIDSLPSSAAERGARSCRPCGRQVGCDGRSRHRADERMRTAF